jgi:hypothetical protein
MAWLTVGACFVFAAMSSLGVVFAVFALMGLATVLVWRYPAWAAVVLVALVPTNRFLILLVFHYGHSGAITSLAQLWKDLLIALLLVRAVDDIILRRRLRLHYVDALVAAFVALSVAYLIYPGNTGQIGFLNRMLGFRADTYFILSYFVGRGLVLQRRHVRSLLTWLIPGSVVVAIIAAAQFVWAGWFNRLFNKLGYAAFINTQSKFGDADVVRSRAIAGVNLPRASSLLLGDLALAFFSILAIAVGAALLLTSPAVRGRVVYGGFTAVAFAALVFTLTRSALIATVVMLIFMALVAGRWLHLGGLAVVLTIGILLAMVSGFIPVRAVGALANPHEASVQAHGGAIREGLTLLGQEPLGRGLGTTGTIGQRVFGSSAITTENWYLAVSIELGVVPGLLFLAASIGVAVEALVSFRRVRDPGLRRIALTVLGASVGFLVLGNMLSVWEVPVISIAFWLLAGVAVGARETDSDHEYRVSP